jgi:NAD(P)-dependent dehydrogenase (short-subunit alcohol dehydrogenase family)
MFELVPGAAMVTGGGSGIGRATALALAARGAPVGVLDFRRDAAQAVATEIGAAGGRAIAIQADVSSWPDVGAAFATLRDTYGQLAIVVNAAGILDAYKLVEDTDLELWDRVIAINLTGTFLCCKRALAEMIPAGVGRIINIASQAGLVGDGGGAAYVTSKHGVVGLTRRISSTYAQKGITANAVCPGPVETNLRATSPLILGPGAPDMSTAGRSIEQLKAFLPIPRRAAPEEIAAAICYLASVDTGFVNGLMLSIDGGWSAI